jgi:hypothetical protein
MYQPYKYDPSLPAAAVFAAAFGMSTILHAYQLVRWKTWYFIPFLVGGLCKFFSTHKMKKPQPIDVPDQFRHLDIFSDVSLSPNSPILRDPPTLSRPFSFCSLQRSMQRPFTWSSAAS